MGLLLAMLERFKNLYEANAPLVDVIPSLYAQRAERYKGYTLRQLCDEMHGFYRSKNIKELQRLCFRYDHFPEQAIPAREASQAMVGGDVDFVPMTKVGGRIAATLALIYPPGIGIVVPGERYDAAAKPMVDYFLAFEEATNLFPGFGYEVQGVYQETVDGKIRFHTYVVKE